MEGVAVRASEYRPTPWTRSLVKRFKSLGLKTNRSRTDLLKSSQEDSFRSYAITDCVTGEQSRRTEKNT